MLFYKFKVVIISKSPTGESLEQTFWFKKNPMVIGRSKDSDLSFLGDGISRKHIKVEYLDNRIYITDLGSKNGTFYNGEQVYPDERFYYQVGTNLSLGNAKEKFQIFVFQEGERAIEQEPSKTFGKTDFENLFNMPVTETTTQSDTPGDYKTRVSEVNDLEIINPAKLKEEDRKARGVTADSILSKQNHHKVDLEVQEKRNELALVNEELRNAKAQLHQKLKAMDLEFENRRLELEAKFNREKNQMDLEIMKLEKKLAILKSDEELQDLKNSTPALPSEKKKTA